SEAYAMVDGDKMKQVFWNICENAVRAMPGGGTLTVSITAGDGTWQISFVDTGRGISPQMLEKIFEPFQSRFEGGTGFGLAIVYQILQAHGAKVAVRSSQGSAAEFTVEIARADRKAQPARQESPEAAEMAAAKAGGAHG